MAELLKFWKIQTYSPDEFFKKVCNAEDEKIISRKQGKSLINLFSRLKSKTSNNLSKKDNKCIDTVFEFLEIVF